MKYLALIKIIIVTFILTAATLLPADAQTIRRVTTGGDAGADGGTWAAAMTLQAALVASTVAGDQVWIAAGTYIPHATDKTVSFSIPAGVLVYGGFVGDEAADFDPATTARTGAATILSGDLLGDDIARPATSADQTAYDATRDENSNSVVIVGGVDVTLDGLTIQGGSLGASTANGDLYGGGLYSTFANTTVNACVFTNNRGFDSGGGAYFASDGATVTNCVFASNTTGDSNWGAGTFFFSDGSVINSTFYSNEAPNGRGGGLYARIGGGGALNLQNSLFVGNTATNAASGHQVFVRNLADEDVIRIQTNLIEGGADPMGTDQGVVYVIPGGAGITESGTVDAAAAAVFASTTANEANFLRLSAGSPALNAGNNTYASGITTDAAGAARIQDGTVDLGAYESKVTQTIMFTSPAVGTIGTDIELEATGGASGQPVTFAVTPGGTGTASLDGNGTTLTLTGAGTVIITATQAGNDTYAAAMDVEQTITVTKVAQVISFAGSPAVATVGTDIELVVAGGASGEPVTLAITTGDGLATLSGTTLSPTGAGTVIITAMQDGNANYEAATNVTHEITVGQGTQTLSFAGSPAVATVGTDIELVVAGGASGESVTLAITTGSGLATLSGTTLSPTGAGTVIITAMQDGNVNYEAAPNVTHEIMVGQGTQTISFAGSPTGGPVGTDLN